MITISTSCLSDEDGDVDGETVVTVDIFFKSFFMSPDDPGVCGTGASMNDSSKATFFLSLEIALRFEVENADS